MIKKFKKFITYGKTILSSYRKCYNREISIYHDDEENNTREVFNYQVEFSLKGKVKRIFQSEVVIHRATSYYNETKKNILIDNDAVDKYKELTDYENKPMKQIYNIGSDFTQSLVDSTESNYYRNGKEYFVLYLEG